LHTSANRRPVGKEVTLKNLFGKWSWTSQTRGQTSEVMRFRVARKEKDESTIPEKLAPDLTFPDPEEAELTREFNVFGSALGMYTINEKVFDRERIDARPRLGSTEIWEFNSAFDHPMHLHLVHFKVLSRGGKRPGPYDAGWKDTVFVKKGEDVRVVARFDGYRGKYVFHCHNLEHEDMMMMANFEVV
jgi:spore coat protein A, manganese oxidase